MPRLLYARPTVQSVTHPGPGQVNVFHFISLGRFRLHHDPSKEMAQEIMRQYLRERECQGICQDVVAISRTEITQCGVAVGGDQAGRQELDGSEISQDRAQEESRLTIKGSKRVGRV
jgi:hypothetical protein